MAEEMKTIFDSMREEEQQAEVEYARLIIEDAGKTHLDILPAEFKSFQRSILKKQVLFHIDRVTEFINQSPLYKGRVFTKLEVTRYMMRGTDYSNFYLAYKYIPRVSTMDVFFDRDRKEFKQLPKEEQDVVLKPYQDLESELQWLKQAWEQYQSRVKVRKGEVIHSYDIEENGIPRTSRGNLCYLFTSVKGKWIKDLEGSIKLHNPRNKKTITLKIDQYVASDDVYSCVDDKGKKYYLAPFETVNDAWDALFSSNKEIFAGWWNKTLIWK